MNRVFIALAALLLLVARTSVALIVPQGNYITDTETGLDWLKVTETRGLSFQEVEARMLPGGSLEGWRYATTQEFDALMPNLGIPDPAMGTGGQYFEQFDAELPEVTNAIYLLGDTYDEYLLNEGVYLSRAIGSGGAGQTVGMLRNSYTNGNQAPIMTGLIFDNDLVYFAHPDIVSQPWHYNNEEGRYVDYDEVISDFTGHTSHPTPWTGTRMLSNVANAQVGSFLVRDTTYVHPFEVCDNGLDDDLDGLIDGADPDCQPPPPPVGLQVRCMHNPIYPMEGELVTITAQGIDDNADRVISDRLEIYVGTMATPLKSSGGIGGGIGTLNATLTASGSFSYGCRAIEATETAQSWQLANPKLRSVDVGGANNPDWEAQPVIYNGPVKEKIDIVFFHDMTDYTSYTDPIFLNDVYNLVNNGLWTMPWFVQNQWAFNIWIARANGADASPKGTVPPNQSVANCNRTNTNEIQNIFNRKYKFRDAGAIVHSTPCRDNANMPRTFTVQANRPGVLAHEMGHRPFGMKDEYCNSRAGTTQLICDGGHGQVDPFANEYKTENGCRDSAADRPYEPDDCRLLVDQKGRTWWLGEPRYSIQPPFSSTQVRDLMQQTGWRESVPGSGVFDTPTYKVGLTEIDRMNWFLQKCIEGKCGNQIR